MNRTSVDAYLSDGCGRCDKYQTPECKVHLWTAPLAALRGLVRSTGLVEEMKWGSPCYSLDGTNVVMIGSLKAFCAISFMFGAALVDDEGHLESPGPSSRYVRYVKFRTLADFEARREYVERLIGQAMAYVRSGQVFEPPPAADPVPNELEARLEADPAVRTAWEALTAGRRRSHVLFVSGAKQADTRERRVERCIPLILAGQGQFER